MKFHVRAPTYYQLHKDQKHYIRNLLEKENSAKEMIQDLVQKLEKYGESVNFGNLEDEKSIENNAKEEAKRTEDEISKEITANSPNELSTMMQKYMMSPEDVSSEGEIIPKQLDWNELADIPDFHSCSELMSQEFLESPDEEEKEFSPLG